MKIHVLVRARNADKYIEKCIRSLIRQVYPEWVALIALDNPEDSTYSIVKTIKDDRIVCICRGERYGLGRNMYAGIKDIERIYKPKDDDVFARVDGDDFISKKAFKHVYNKYKKHPDALITYGSYIKMSKGRKTKTSRPYPTYANIRKHRWQMSHLFTAKWKLVKNVKPEWFKMNGKWIDAASDLALAFPLAEIAGMKRCVHISSPVYYWRDSIPTSTKRALQKKTEKYLRNA